MGHQPTRSNGNIFLGKSGVTEAQGRDTCCIMRRSPFSLTRNTLHTPCVGFRWFVAWTTVLCLQVSWFSWAKEELVEEQVTFSAGEIELEGLFATPAQPPTIGAVVCHPHP